MTSLYVAFTSLSMGKLNLLISSERYTIDPASLRFRSRIQTTFPGFALLCWPDSQPLPASSLGACAFLETFVHVNVPNDIKTFASLQLLLRIWTEDIFGVVLECLCRIFWQGVDYGRSVYQFAVMRWWWIGVSVT